MRIAIVGAGISGLATAHLLHPSTRSPCSRRATTRAGTPTPSGSTPRTRPTTSTRLHRLQRPQLPALRAAAGASRRRVAAVEHELRRLRRAATSSTAAPRRTGCSPSARTSSRRGFTAWSPTSCASTATPATLLRRADDGPSLGHWLDERRYSRAFVERLIVPQASAVWSADPRQMWTFPARFLVEFFDNHGMLGFRDRPQWRTIAGGSRALRRGADRGRSRERLRLAHAGRGRSRAHEDHVR